MNILVVLICIDASFGLRWNSAVAQYFPNRWHYCHKCTNSCCCNNCYPITRQRSQDPNGDAIVRPLNHNSQNPPVAPDSIRESSTSLLSSHNTTFTEMHPPLPHRSPHPVGLCKDLLLCRHLPPKTTQDQALHYILAFWSVAPSLWNAFPDYLRGPQTVDVFKQNTPFKKIKRRKKKL